MIGEPASLLSHKVRKICSSGANPDTMAEGIRILLQSERQTLVNNCIGARSMERANVTIARSQPVSAPLH